MIRRCLKALLMTGLGAGLWLVMSPRAYAYVDAGSASYVIQVVIGGVMGMALALATFWKRIRAFFARSFGRASTDE